MKVKCPGTKPKIIFRLEDSSAQFNSSFICPDRDYSADLCYD